MITLTLSQTIDMLDMVTNSKYSLPSSNRVGSDDRVFSGELGANIKWVTTSLSVEGELLLTSCVGEEWLSVSGSEPVEELLVGGGESVVNFISGGPESVY